MIQTHAASRLFVLAGFCLAAAGCLTQEAFDGIGAELDRQFEQKTAEIDDVLNKVGAGITDSADRAQKDYEDFRDRLIRSYEQAQKPPEPVLFGEDGKPVARPALPPGASEKEHVSLQPAPPPEIQSEFLSEKTLEHRGLRLLWKLALDGSGVRYTDVNGDHLYVVTKRNRMYSIELKTGLTRWVAGLSGRPDGPPGFNADYVVISAADTVHVIEKAVGKDKWRFETDIQSSSRPFCDATEFVFGCWDGSVCGFQFGDERYPRWRFKARDRVFAAPYSKDGYAFAAADDGTCSRYHVSERLSAGDTSLGGRPVGDLLGTPELIFIGTENFEMVALKEADGSVVWRHGCGGRVLEGPWLFDGGNVLLYSAHDAGLYALTAATGKERWRIPEGVRPVALVGQHLFVLRSDGTVCRADAATGQVLWSESIAPFATAVAHMANEVVYLVSADGQVFAVAPKK